MDYGEGTYLTKHRQIIEALTMGIQEGRLKPYDRLPSEKELSEQWQASRSTVRKAMDQLTDRGRIFRVPGKGSFVSFPKISHDTSQILSFTEKMKTQGLDVTTRLIGKEIITPTEQIASALKISPSDCVLKIQRLRIVQGEPLALQTAFILPDICGDLMREDLESMSLNYLLERCNVRLSRNDLWIEAPMISSWERQLLGNPPAPTFLAVVGLTFDQHDNPVRFSRGVFRGDRIRLKIGKSNVFELDYLRLPSSDVRMTTHAVDKADGFAE